MALRLRADNSTRSLCNADRRRLLTKIISPATQPTAASRPANPREILFSSSALSQALSHQALEN
jgi:hypothetical protein